MKRNKEGNKVIQSYTRATFLANICDSLPMIEEDNDKLRAYSYKQKIINYLCCIEKDIPMYNIGDPKSFDLILDKFNNMVQENEMLFSYTFFLASNRNFNYTWSYLRKQMVEYTKICALFFKALDYMVADINALKEKLSGIDGISIVFNNLYSVRFISDAPYATTELLWDNFNTNFTNVNKGYYVSAKYDKTILLTTFREYKNKDFYFADSILQLIKMRGNVEEDNKR